MSATPQAATIREKLLDLPEGLEIWRVSPILLKEQDKNARVQSPGQFKALVRNVQRRGTLESVPFVSRQGDEFSIISGHHRTRAAIQANLESIIVLADPTDRSRSEIVAKQIAHNRINGQDDSSVLLQLLAEIQDLDSLIEAAVDKAELEKAVKTSVAVPDVAVDFEWSSVHFVFLPTQVNDLEGLCEMVGDGDLVGVADQGIYDAFVKTMRKLGKTENIRSVGAILFRMMELTQAHLDALAQAEAAQAAAEEGPAPIAGAPPDQSVAPEP